MGFGPLFLADFLAGCIDRIDSHLMPLPGSFFLFLTLCFLASRLIFMPGAWIKKIPAIDTLDLFHGHLLPVRENGVRIKELDQSDGNERN